MNLVDTWLWADWSPLIRGVIYGCQNVERCVEWETMEPGGWIHSCLCLDDDVRALFASGRISRGVMEVEGFVLFEIFDCGHEFVPGSVGVELDEHGCGVPIDVILVVGNVIDHGELCCGQDVGEALFDVFFPCPIGDAVHVNFLPCLSAPHCLCDGLQGVNPCLHNCVLQVLLHVGQLAGISQ